MLATDKNTLAHGWSADEVRLTGGRLIVSPVSEQRRMIDVCTDVTQFGDGQMLLTPSGQDHNRSGQKHAIGQGALMSPKLGQGIRQQRKTTGRSAVGTPLRRQHAKQGVLRVAIALLLVIALAVSSPKAGAKPVEEDDAPGVCRSSQNATLARLDRVFVRDEFRLFYTLKGKHALPNRADRNDNAVPDKVEDVAIQLTAASRLFSEVMGLRHPLTQTRYQRAVSIDVFLLNLDSGNGFAYDEVVNYSRARNGERQCALRIDLKNSHSNQNPSPAHELFHLYQYGYSMFKTRWLLEGTARWSEHAFRPRATPAKALPSDDAALGRDLLSKTYAAGPVWDRLTALLDPAGRTGLSRRFAMTYLDGNQVIKADALHGASFIKALLEELGHASIAAAQENAWDRYNWREADQRSAVHDARILRAVFSAARGKVRKEGIEDAELEAFLRIPLPRS